MKKYKNFIFLGIIIVALIIGVIIISGIDTSPTTTDIEEAEVIEIYSVKKEDISFVSIENEFGKYTMSYVDGVKIEGLDAEKDDEKISSLSGEISSMYATSVVSENEAELKSFGLDVPKAKLTLTLKNGETKALHLGDKTPTYSGYYIKTSDKNTVYIVGTYSAEVLLRKLDYYRTTDLFNFDISSVSQLSFEKNGKKVQFNKNIQSEEETNIFAAFSMITPYNWGAESSEIEKVLKYLNELEISEYVEDNSSDLSKYGIGAAKISVTENNKTNVINIGSNKDGKLYVTMNNDKTVYLVDGKGFEFLDYEPTAFLQQFVLIRSIDNVKKLDYTHNDIKAEFDIKKIDIEMHDIKYNGKLTNQKKFKNLYTEIISMTTSGTVDFTPSGAPLMEYTFTYNDGKKDNVKYYKYDERKIAVSVNGKVYFYVDSSEFETRAEKIDNIIKNDL